MSTTISDIRFRVERELSVSLDDATVLIWCNDAQTDFSLMVNVPETDTIALTTTDLQYAEPADLKAIRRLYLQSDIDNGRNIEFTWNYYRFGGFINFYTPYYQTDTLNVDYFRHMKYFTSTSDTIDIEDRFVTVYTYYCKAMSSGSDKFMIDYNKAKKQVINYYSLSNESYTVKERW